MPPGPPASEPRTCGTCTMCCKLIGVVELNKPRNEWCRHCNIGVGCAVYQDRPGSCREFKCAWLQDDSAMLPGDQRPDMAGVVIFFPEDKSAQVHVDPNRPEAWRRGRTGKILNFLAQQVPVLVTIGDRRKFLGTEKMMMDLEIKLGMDIGKEGNK